MLVNQWQCLKSISGVPGLADKKIWRILGGRRRRTRGRWWRSSGDSIWYLHNRHILLSSGKLSLWPQIYTQSVPNSWNELHIRHFWNWQPFETLCPGISWLSSITYSRVTSTLTWISMCILPFYYFWYICILINISWYIQCVIFRKSLMNYNLWIEFCLGVILLCNSVQFVVHDAGWKPLPHISWFPIPVHALLGATIFTQNKCEVPKPRTNLSVIWYDQDHCKINISK